MKSHEKTSIRRSLVPREYLASPVRVESGAFRHFSEQINEQLQQLEARWGHLAPPRLARAGWRR
jgi:hypothetical protein